MRRKILILLAFAALRRFSASSQGRQHPRLVGVLRRARRLDGDQYRQLGRRG